MPRAPGTPLHPPRACQLLPQPAWGYPLLLLVLICSWGLSQHGAHAACRVRFGIDATASTLVLTTSNLLRTPAGNNISSPSSFPSNVMRGLLGSLYADSNAPAPCPPASDASAWLAALPQFNFSSEASPFFYQAVSIYPILHNGRTPLAKPGYSDYNLSHFEIRMQSYGVQAAGPASGSGSGSDAPQVALTMPWYTTIRNGWIYSNNVITKQRMDSLANNTANATAPATVSVQATPGGGSALVLDVPQLSITYITVTTLDMGTTVYEAIASFTWTGRLLAKALLDCPTYCGDFGMCRDVFGRGTCMCDCGWAVDARGQCNQPRGFCANDEPLPPAPPSPPPLPPGASAPIAALPTSSPPPQSPAPNTPPAGNSSSSGCTGSATGDGSEGGSGSGRAQSVAPENGVCPFGYDFDRGGSSCKACPDGFTGNGCSFCTSDTACRANLTSSSAQCVISPVYRARSQLKHYACELLDPNIVSILGRTLNFACSTRPPASADVGVGDATFEASAYGQGASSPVDSTPYCDLHFRLDGMPRDASVQCTGWSCEFALNSSRVHCGMALCDCPKGCVDVNAYDWAPTFRSVRSQVTISCQPGVSSQGLADCKIELSGLPIDAIPMQCSTAECMDPLNGTDIVTAVVVPSSEPLVLPPIIAWVPTMVLVLLTLTVLIAVASHRTLLAPPRTAPRQSSPASAAASAAASAGADAAPRSQAAGPIAEAAEHDAEPGVALRAADAAGANGSHAPGSASSAGASGGSSGPAELSIINPLAVPSAGAGPGKQAGLGGVQGAPPTPRPRVLSNSGALGAKELALQWRLNQALVVRTFSWHGLTVTLRASSCKWRLPRMPCCGRCAPSPSSSSSSPSTQPVLLDVSGHVRQSQLMGLLGPSGSGKTTLLSVLAGHVQGGRQWDIRGRITVNGGAAVAPHRLATLVGHVPQHDLLVRSLTVRECLRYNAVLRVGADVHAPGMGELLEARMRAVLEELDILHLQDRVVWPGGAGSSAGAALSGGERLRVSAAMELVPDPPVLLLDEPTSGLDAYSARNMLRTLQRVAVAGRVVLASLHQPSPAQVAVLDVVLLLARGRVVFAGTPAQAEGAFAAMGLACPRGVEIAEHMLDVVSDPAFLPTITAAAAAQLEGSDFGGMSVEASGKAAAADVEAAAEAAEVARTLALAEAATHGSGVMGALRRGWLELGVMYWRTGLDMLRNPMLTALHMMATGIIGLLVGAVFFDVGLDTSGAQNRVGSVFFSINLIACLATTAVDTIQSERAVAERELLRRTYGPLSYMAAKLLLDALLLRLLPAWAYALPYYWMMGLRDQAAAFFTFMGVFCCMSCLSGAFCLMLSALMDGTAKVVLLHLMFVLAWSLFSGFLANKETITPVLKWIIYISPVRYSWEAIVINELDDLTLNFSSPDLPRGLPAVKGSLFLSLLGVDSDMLMTDLVVLGCMYAIFAMAALLAMWWRVVWLRG